MVLERPSERGLGAGFVRWVAARRAVERVWVRGGAQLAPGDVDISFTIVSEGAFSPRVLGKRGEILAVRWSSLPFLHLQIAVARARRHL